MSIDFNYFNTLVETNNIGRALDKLEGELNRLNIPDLKKELNYISANYKQLKSNRDLKKDLEKEEDNIKQKLLFFLVKLEQESDTKTSEKIVAQMTKILFLTANPYRATSSNKEFIYLDLAREKKLVEAELGRAKFRDRFELKKVDAASLNELLNGLIEFQPSIVQFSGHSTIDGIQLLDESGNVHLVSGANLAELLGQFKSHIKCVILNSCLSIIPGEEICQYIDFVIGMKANIEEPTAHEFSKSFYKSLGGGLPIPSAFCIAKTMIAAQVLRGSDLPILYQRIETDGEIVIVEKICNK